MALPWNARYAASSGCRHAVCAILVPFASHSKLSHDSELFHREDPDPAEDVSDDATDAEDAKYATDADGDDEADDIDVDGDEADEADDGADGHAAYSQLVSRTREEAIDFMEAVESARLVEEKELRHHVLASGSLPSGTIILDGAATCTVFTSTKGCTNIRHGQSIRIKVGGPTPQICTTIADRTLSRAELGGDIDKLVIKDARIIPRFGTQVISEALLLARGADIHKRCDESGVTTCLVRNRQGVVIMRPVRHPNGLFTLPLDSTPDAVMVSRSYSKLDQLTLWHVRLGHRSYRDVAQYLKTMGIPFTIPKNIPWCAACVQGKSQRYPMSRLPRSFVSPRAGYLLHSDSCGPFAVPTRGDGARYFNILVDDYSGYIWAALLERKDQFYPHLAETILVIEAEQGSTRVVSMLHTDGAGEFQKSQFVIALCAKKGIRLSSSPADTPSLNAVAERTIRTVCEMARTMMIHAEAPPGLWGEAVLYAVYVLNNLPNKVGSKETRTSRYHGQPPPTTPPVRCKTWFCEAYAHLTSKKDRTPKLVSKPKAIRCVIAGYNVRNHSYRLLVLPDYTAVKHSGHVVFNEDCLPARELAQTDDPVERTEFVTDNSQCRMGGLASNDVDDAAAAIAVTPAGAAPISSGQKRRMEALSIGTSASPLFADEAVALVYLAKGDALPDPLDIVPIQWAAVLRLPEPFRTVWIGSGREEYDSHVQNGTLGKTVFLDDLPKDTKLIRIADLRKYKRDRRAKTRLVVKGFTMVSGLHYNDTFAPVVHITTFRVMLVLGCARDYEIKQGDVPTAFMLPPIDCALYIAPNAFLRYFHAELRAKEKGGRRVAIEVLKGLPGIPQGSRLWNKLMHDFLTKIGFKRSEVDYGLYTILEDELYLLLWVDDLFYFYPKRSEVKAAAKWKKIQERFKVGDMEDIDDALGVTITRDRKSKKMFVSQEKAILTLKARERLDDIKGAPVTPMESGLKLSREDCPSDRERASRGQLETWYRSALASAIYFVSWTRPDMAYAVSKLARFMNNPSDAAVAALKRALRYLFANAHLGLMYDPSESRDEHPYHAYYDASHADCPDTRRSTGGWVTYLHGCAVQFHSKLLTFVTTGTNHSEYVTGAGCARECNFQSNLAVELGMTRPTIQVHSDSTGSIAQSYNPTNRAASKHVDLADHYIREMVERKRICLSYICTKDMDADIFTKPLDRIKFVRHRERMMGQSSL